jgi:two-component system OmpR family response regulator
VTLKVLYVDDEADIREVAAMSLEMDPGMEVRTAQSGADALALLDAGDWTPDVLLLDVMMPAMDGPTLLKAIRTRRALDGAPAIFITARAQQQERERFIAAGAVGVIAKPFDPLTLAREVRATIGA